MVRFSFLAVTAAAVLSRGSAFVPSGHASVSRPTRSASGLCLMPETVDAASNAVDTIDAASSSLLLLSIDFGLVKETVKTVLIVLFCGGGLIPATIAANQGMMDTLMRKRPEKKELTDEQKSTNLDPTFGMADYIEDSGATGESLTGSALLFAPERIPLADIVAIVGRISDVDSVADWRNLPSAKRPGAANPDKPPMWLPRATFKYNIRKNKFQGWPVDAEGKPIGGEELRAAEERRVSKAGALIGDAALDAVFDTWAWGANIATPDKVNNELRSWRGPGGQFNQQAFTLGAISGRSLVGIAALTFVIVQLLAYGTLFIAPALRVLANIDIGFGEMGECDPTMCTHLFQ